MELSRAKFLEVPESKQAKQWRGGAGIIYLKARCEILVYTNHILPGSALFERLII